MAGHVERLLADAGTGNQRCIERVPQEGIFFQRFPEAVCFIIQACKFNIEWFEDPSFAVAGIIAAFYPLVIIIPDGKIKRLQVEQVDAVDETHFRIDEGFGIRKPAVVGEVLQREYEPGKNDRIRIADLVGVNNVLPVIAVGLEIEFDAGP